MRKIILGMSAWGEHLELFLKYGLPSLMTPGNLPALAKERQIILKIHTDKEGFNRVLESKVPYLWCEKIDITDEDKYLQLGRHQNADLKHAKDSFSDYHCLLPDFVYSENCFSGILNAIARGHKAITRLIVSTVQEDILSELGRPRSAVDLATLSFQHIHPGVRNWLITEKGYPGTHAVAWIGKDTLTMCSPHQALVYAAHEVINPIDSNLPLDCILDQVVIGEFYCPKPEDQIVIIEISPRESRKPEYACVSLEDFCQIMKCNTKNSFRQWALFNEETVDRIDRKKIGTTNYWSDGNIVKSKETMHNALSQVMGG